MFNIFSKKSKIKKLETKRQKLLEESFKLSRVNRTESDRKAAEADEIQRQIEDLEKMQEK